MSNEQGDDVLRELFREGLTAREVPKDADGNYVRGGLGQWRPTTMRLMKLTLENFRAFLGENNTFDFEGRNVLVYGENGSGKTSLWAALDTFFAASLAKDVETSCAGFHKQRYQHNSDPGQVRLEVLDELNQTNTYVWSEEETPYNSAEIMSAARVRACLDYRALWETYFLHSKENHVDIWPLLIEVLIPQISTLYGNTLSEQWKLISRLVDKPEQVSVVGILKTMVEEVNSNLEFILNELRALAQQILNQLSSGLEFDWQVVPASSFLARRKTIYGVKPPRVILSVTLHKNALTNHQNLLNEARLSALALSIYFAAALLNAKQARSAFKILALDDVLIGLDMSNRVPVLEVLESFFKGWQIFLFTYDRSWYELAATKLGKERWKHFEFASSEGTPVYTPALDLLKKSAYYLQAAQDRLPDYKAAGVYARSAFETMLKCLFNKHNLPLPYKAEGNYMLGDFLPLIDKLEMDGLHGARVPLLEPDLLSKVKASKKQHYNPLCHSQVINYQKPEVESAIKILEELQEVFKTAKKVSFPKIKSTSNSGVDLRTADMSQYSKSELGQILGNAKAEIERKSRAEQQTE